MRAKACRDAKSEESGLKPSIRLEDWATLTLKSSQASHPWNPRRQILYNQFQSDCLGKKTCLVLRLLGSGSRGFTDQKLRKLWSLWNVTMIYSRGPSQKNPCPSTRILKRTRGGISPFRLGCRLQLLSKTSVLDWWVVSTKNVTNKVKNMSRREFDHPKHFVLWNHIH